MADLPSPGQHDAQISILKQKTVTERVPEQKGITHTHTHIYAYTTFSGLLVTLEYH